MPNRNSEVLTFERGLDEFVEASRLAPGTATKLLNWVPESDGSLRVRQSWRKATVTGLAARAGRGLAYFPKTEELLAIVRNAAGTGYAAFSLPEDSRDAGTWLSEGDTVPAVSAGNLYIPSAVGLGKVLFGNHEFGLLRQWDSGLGVADLAGSKPGRALTFYKNRVFTAGGSGDGTGTNTAPWRLFYTGPGDVTNWAGLGSGNVDIGKDDGQAINTIEPFENGVLVGKDASMHYLLGTNPTNFNLIQLDSGEAAPGRTIVATPYGALICGNEEVFLFDGDRPVPISRPVSSSYGFDGRFITCAFIEGSAYIAEEGNPNILVYDFEGKSWHIEDFNDVLAHPVILMTRGDTLYGLQGGAAAGNQLHYREVPEGARQADSVGETLEAWTPEFWLGGAASPTTIRHVYLRLRQRGGDPAMPGIEVEVWVNGSKDSEQTVLPQHQPGVFRKRLDFGGTGYFLQFRFRQKLDAGDQSAMDIEEIEIIYDAEKDR